MAIRAFVYWGVKYWAGTAFYEYLNNECDSLNLFVFRLFDDMYFNKNI